MNTPSCLVEATSLQPNDADPGVAFLVNELSFSAHFTYIQNRRAAASNASFLSVDGARVG